VNFHFDIALRSSFTAARLPARIRWNGTETVVKTFNDITMIQNTLIIVGCLAITVYASFASTSQKTSNEGNPSISVGHVTPSDAEGINVAQAAPSCSPSPSPGG
jgi:hypothetical protein